MFGIAEKLVRRFSKQQQPEVIKVQPVVPEKKAYPVLLGTNRCFFVDNFNVNGFADAIYIHRRDTVGPSYRLQKIRVRVKNGEYFFVGHPGESDIPVAEALENNKWLKRDLLVFGVQSPNFHDQQERGVDLTEARLKIIEKAGHVNLANEIRAEIQAYNDENHKKYLAEAPLREAWKAAALLERQQATIKEIKSKFAHFSWLAAGSLLILRTLKPGETFKVDRTFAVQCSLILLDQGVAALTDEQFLEAFEVTREDIKFLSSQWL